MQAHDIPVAYAGKYQGQFHFLGRLIQVIETVDNEQFISWASTHPDGYMISLEDKKDTNVNYIQRQRERWLIFRTGRQTMQGQRK